MRPLLELIFESVSGAGKPDKMEIFARLFPGKNVSEGSLEKSMTALSNLIRSFLLTNHYWKADNEFYQNLDWAVILRNRNLKTRYLNTVKKLRQIQEVELYQSSEFYLKQFLLEDEVHYWESLHNKAKGDQNLPATLRQLGLFYHLNQIELNNRLLLQQRIAQVNFVSEEKFEHSIIEIPALHLQESTLLKINFHIYQLLGSKVPNIVEFIALEDLLKQHEKELEPDVRQEFYAFLRNLCTILLNFGFLEMRPVLFRIQKENLEKGYFYINGKISPGAFANIVISALRLDEFVWVLKFMEEHKERIIGGEDTNDFFQLNMATYFFALGDFNQCLNLIPDAPVDNLYLIRARRLRLKAYYEIKSELLLYELDAFKMLLSRAAQKTISPALRGVNANFVNFLYQITKTAPYDKPKLMKIFNRISAKNSVAEKEWLLEKIQRSLK